MAITACITKVPMATAKAGLFTSLTVFEALGTPLGDPQGCLIAHRNTSAASLRRPNCD